MEKLPREGGRLEIEREGYVKSRRQILRFVPTSTSIHIHSAVLTTKADLAPSILPRQKQQK
jgi:hypothetical protein